MKYICILWNYGLPLYQQNETLTKINCYENTDHTTTGKHFRRDYHYYLHSTNLLHRTIINHFTNFLKFYIMKTISLKSLNLKKEEILNAPAICQNHFGDFLKKRNHNKRRRSGKSQNLGKPSWKCKRGKPENWNWILWERKCLYMADSEKIQLNWWDFNNRNAFGRL